MSELTLPIPPVVLTPHAFICAQEAEIGSISPDVQGIRAVIGITDAADLQQLPPVTTVLRVHRLTDRDQIFKEAPDDFPYIPAQGLPEEGQSMCQISARSLREKGGKIIELTISDWSKLPEHLAERLAFQIEGLKVHTEDIGPEYETDALSVLASWCLRPSPRYLHQQAARSARPYSISYRRDKPIY